MDEILDEKNYETRKVEYASFAPRTAAFIADLLIFMLLGFALNFAFRLSPTFFGFFVIFWWQILLILSFYFIYFDGSENNATLGKQIMNIRLLTTEKRELDFATSAKHFVISILLFFGYFALLSNEKKQTFADKICKVMLVKIK